MIHITNKIEVSVEFVEPISDDNSDKKSLEDIAKMHLNHVERLLDSYIVNHWALSKFKVTVKCSNDLVATAEESYTNGLS